MSAGGEDVALSRCIDSAPGGASLGAVLLADERCLFRVWAPLCERVWVHLLTPHERTVALEPIPLGYHEAIVHGVAAGSRYRFRLADGAEYPDPASRFQPEGVHGPSQVVEPPATPAAVQFSAPTLASSVFYELHVGTFSEAGTFAGVIPHLDHLVDLGVTTVELMPVAQFPGERNWGYDGVFPWAVQNSYGGPAGLAALVDECHERGLAVALDVVYNHLGPEGNNLARFGPYFTDRYRTPWGPALNFDGPGSDEVRRFFLQSAMYFVTELRIDVLRLDAVHAILDTTARPFLEAFAEAVQRRATEAGRRVLVIGESSLNDPRLIRPRSEGGLGLDGQWSDDFHHACHVLVTGEQEGYYADFRGPRDLATAYRAGFVYQGQRSEFLNRAHGRPASDRAPSQLVVCTQNHDQIGNRARGDRLAESLEAAQQRLLAGLLLLGPSTPLMFMGQEWGATAPFAYFTSHGDPGLVEAVRRGRVEEFVEFGWKAEDIPDPQDPATFARSRLDWTQLAEPDPQGLLELHRRLIQLRRSHAALASERFADVAVELGDGERWLVLRRVNDTAVLTVVFSLSAQAVRVDVAVGKGGARLLLDSEEAASTERRAAALGPSSSEHRVTVELAPWSFVVFESARDAHDASSESSDPPTTKESSP